MRRKLKCRADSSGLAEAENKGTLAILVNESASLPEQLIFSLVTVAFIFDEQQRKVESVQHMQRAHGPTHLRTGSCLPVLFHRAGIIQSNDCT